MTTIMTYEQVRHDADEVHAAGPAPCIAERDADEAKAAVYSWETVEEAAARRITSGGGTMTTIAANESRADRHVDYLSESFIFALTSKQIYRRRIKYSF